jgi:hypothetical protein
MLGVSSILFVPLPTQGALQLVNISKGKAGAESPFGWEGASCSGFSVFNSSFQWSQALLKFIETI